MAHLVDGVEIIRNHKLPVAETLAEHFVSLPAEKFLRGGRPAQDSELVVPFDDCEWRVLDVKSEALFFECRSFDGIALGHVADDSDATDDRSEEHTSELQSH